MTLAVAVDVTQLFASELLAVGIPRMGEFVYSVLKNVMLWGSVRNSIEYLKLD